MVVTCFERLKRFSIIYTAFQKAFDCVSHLKISSQAEIRLYNLRSFLTMVESILSNGTQVVNISGHFTDAITVTSGVPQGSVVEPTLFLLYINEIGDSLFSTVVYMKLFALS